MARKIKENQLRSQIPEYTCCVAFYGEDEGMPEAVSFAITRIGDKSNNVVHKDWLYLEDPETGRMLDEGDMTTFIDKNVDIIKNTYPGTGVSHISEMLPLEKCNCGCGGYLLRVINYEDYLRGLKNNIWKR